MAQPSAELGEDYELVIAPCLGPVTWRLTKLLFYSYESLPPNFSLLQNMAAGAFAGIAVRPIMISLATSRAEIPFGHPNRGLWKAKADRIMLRSIP